MRIWYVHYAPRGWHERNLYLHREVGRVWRADGHKVLTVNVAGPTHTRALNAKDARCDVAYINNFQTLDACEREGLDIVGRSKFRVLITGGGWRRPDWVRSSLKAVERAKASLVCLTHLPHHKEFKRVHRRVFHVGLGFDPAVFYPDWEAKRETVVFYGDGGMGRSRRLKLLERTFPGRTDFSVDCRIPHEEMAGMMRVGAIGWSQIGRGPKEGVSCNLRVWETIGSGLFLLCSRSGHIPLKRGVHYVDWRDDRNMLKKVRHYLDHPDEREEIARAGWEESKKHTWAHRAREYKELVEAHL